MKHSFWGYFVVVCGLVIVVILLLVQRMTTTSEEDFYLAREVLESSMIDAVDYGTYRTTGRLVMSEQKFVEVFIRRFSESVTNNKTYELDFYDIYEEPPKASVKIRTSSGNTANIKDTVFDVNLDTLVSGILETIYSQADGDSSGGNSSGDTTTVACPNGGHKTIHYTPNIPDGEDGEGDEIIDYDPDDLLMSSVINLYSVGYAANKDAYNKDTKTCSGLSITGGADYKISYKALPNGLGEDIVAGRIKSCEIIAGSPQAFTNSSDITEYVKWRKKLGQYLIDYKGGAVNEDVYNFDYYATSAEIRNISIACEPVIDYSEDGTSYGTVVLSVSYNTQSSGRSSANKNLIEHAIAENNRDVYCLIYTGIKWNMKFKYTKN